MAHGDARASERKKEAKFFAENLRTNAGEVVALETQKFKPHVRECRQERLTPARDGTFLPI